MTARRWIALLGTLLLLSLAANIFMGGLMLGRGAGDGVGAGLRVGMQRMMRALPDADRDTVKAILDVRRADLEQKFADLRSARQVAAKLLRDGAFDATAFAAAEQDAREKSYALQDAIRDLVVEAVPQLTPEGRAALAKAPWR